MLSNTCKYAIRAVVYLAVNELDNQKIGIKQISSELDIPSPFLGKILQLLSKNKLLKSTKGPNGGFCLAKNADDIKIIDIVTIIDGLDFFNSCIIGMKVCHKDNTLEKYCPFHNELDPIRSNLYEKFTNLSIGNFKDDYLKLSDVISL
jgi:Rrf2 family transcriptional regulator, iron-sulfur cluster assembly transcription factor